MGDCADQPNRVSASRTGDADPFRSAHIRKCDALLLRHPPRALNLPLHAPLKAGQIPRPVTCSALDGFHLGEAQSAFRPPQQPVRRECQQEVEYPCGEEDQEGLVERTVDLLSASHKLSQAHGIDQ